MNEKVFLGVNLVEPKNTDSDIASICVIIKDETFYFEFNDADLTLAKPELLNKLLFLNNEPTITYKTGEKAITYIKDDQVMISEHIQNILRQYCKEEQIIFIGNVNPIEYVSFYKLLNKYGTLEQINIDENYVSMKSIDLVLKSVKINLLIDKYKELIEESDNLIISTTLVSKIYDGFITKPLK